jgi:hypothetical protein
MILRKKIFSFLAILIAVSCSSSHSDPTPKKQDILKSTGYIIGFDPCNYISGKIISLNESADTVITYTVPEGLYYFPPAVFANQSNFLFADSVARSYPISVTYKVAGESEKQYFACAGIVWWRPELLQRIEEKQILIMDIKTDF